jgi:hypothetical protein
LSPIPKSLRRRLRAEFAEPLCAYCHSPERLLGIPLEVDHIIPASVSGKAEFDNLCLSCRSCNGYKWKSTHARDPQSGRRTRLFHPRRQNWIENFAWSGDGKLIIGLSAVGRATVEALNLNNDLVVELRELWVVLRLHPSPKVNFTATYAEWLNEIPSRK